MKPTKAHILLLGIALFSLNACDRLGMAGNSTEAGSPAANQQLDAYITAHNIFLGSFGFTEKAQEYRESNIANATPNDDFRVSAGTIDQGIEALKTARAMSGGSAELDKAADALLASMPKVQTHLAALEPYYKTKKYVDDDLARGKAEDKQMLAEVDAAVNDLTAFSKQLDAMIEKRDAAMLEKLKSGDPVVYQSKLALMHAKKLLNIFDKATDPTKADVIASADAEVAIIETAMAAAEAEAKKKGEGDPAVKKPLTDMLFYYRSFKQRDELTQLGYMVSAYNQAIEALNSSIS